VKCSVVMASKDRAGMLARTLQSIRSQNVSFEYEVIVVDDGSKDDTEKACKQFDVRYFRLENPIYRNPSVARNVGYRAAVGDIIIAQSDDVMHHTSTAIEQLCELKEGEFCIAQVYYYDPMRKRQLQRLVGSKYPRPFFFLGSLWRSDLYAVGGNDEDFTSPGYDDDWFADCLIRGLGLKCRFEDSIVGYHQIHPRLANLKELVEPSKRLYAQKVAEGKFISSGGAWEMEESVRDWWERMHRQDEKQFLSGYTGKQVWEFLNIEQLLNQGTKALEIGVGLGVCTRDVAERGVELSVLDISEVGLNRVRDFTHKQHQSGSELPSSYFEVVFSHAVAQHMSDDDLVTQIREVLRALTNDGIFAMQFADSPQRCQSLKAQRQGGVCRNLDEIRELVNKAGGRIVWNSEPVHFANKAEWAAVHIRK